MGKSIFLDNLVQNSNSDIFFLKIVLNRFTDELNKLKNEKIKINDPENVFDFILTNILRKTSQLEIKLLKHLAQEKKLILMFDGLDEAIDYKKQVIILINLLNKHCKLKKILVTTRNHLKAELEDEFTSISFDLKMY